MQQFIVQYKVRPDRVEENERLVKDVFAQLKEQSLGDVRYASLKLEDGLSFVHIVSIETQDGSNPITEMSAFRAFSAAIRDRISDGPMQTAFETIGSHRMFG